MNSALKCHAVPGTPGPFLVDGFKHQAASPRTRSFFLSHFHGDHYTGLNSDFNQGTIYCSRVTRALCINVLGVDPARVVPIELGCRTEVEGVRVTLFDANHCPGAVMFQFEAGAGGTTTILHTGDMRFGEKMLQYNFKQPVDTVFLDTTYSKPKYVFLPQREAIAMGVGVVTGSLPGLASSGACPTPNWSNKTLFLVGAYNIGKERLLLALGKALGGTKIVVDPKKMAGQISCVFPDENEREALFTVDENESNLHVCRMSFCGEIWPFFRPNFIPMQQYLDRINAQRSSDSKFERIVGIIPTGWASTSNWNRKNSISQKGCCTVVLIPYSEHSSFNELELFLKSVKARHIEPTVYASETDRLAIMSRFRNLMDRTAGKRRFLQMMKGNKPDSRKKSKTEPVMSSLTSSSTTTSQRRQSSSPSMDVNLTNTSKNFVDLTGEDGNNSTNHFQVTKKRTTGTLKNFFRRKA